MKRMKKKIVHIVESFGGGVYSVLMDLVNKTIDDLEIIVVYGKRKETPVNFKKDFSDKVKFIEIKNFTRSINPKKDIKALKEIKKVIKEENPDIVHLHSSKAGVLGRIAVSGKKVKMFYNPHGFSFLKRDDSKLKRNIYWLIEKITAMFNPECTIIGCSNGEYLEAKKLNKNAICINNGIDIEKLEEETKGLKEKEINYRNLKICTVGRIDYSKNPRMFNKIAENFPQYEFTWIGEGELSNKLISSNINITGWKSRKEVLKLLNEQDIFILASLWEGLPISLLQAMYMKKICIVSNCIGNRDVIINNQNGFIANNLKDYIEILNNLVLNKLDYGVREVAREDSINKFNMKKMIKEYMEAYESSTEYRMNIMKEERV